MGLLCQAFHGKRLYSLVHVVNMMPEPAATLLKVPLETHSKVHKNT